MNSNPTRSYPHQNLNRTMYPERLHPIMDGTPKEMPAKGKEDPPKQTWRRSFNDFSPVTIRMEGEWAPVGRKISKRALFHFAPALLNYLDDLEGDTIILPADSCSDNAAAAVINGILSTAEKGGRLDVWRAYHPVASIEMHRVFTLFGMKKEAEETLATLWDSVQKVELTGEDVQWIWYTFKENIFNKAKRTSSSWPRGPFWSHYSGEYIHAMLYQLVNLANENKLKSEVSSFIELHPRLEGLANARKDEYGMSGGYDRSKSRPIVRSAREAAMKKVLANSAKFKLETEKDRKAHHFAGLQWNERKPTPPPQENKDASNKAGDSGSSDFEDLKTQNAKRNDTTSLFIPEKSNSKSTKAGQSTQTKSPKKTTEDPAKPSLKLERAGKGLQMPNIQGQRTGSGSKQAVKKYGPFEYEVNEEPDDSKKGNENASQVPNVFGNILTSKTMFGTQTQVGTNKRSENNHPFGASGASSAGFQNRPSANPTQASNGGKTANVFGAASPSPGFQGPAFGAPKGLFGNAQTPTHPLPAAPSNAPNGFFGNAQKPTHSLPATPSNAPTGPSTLGPFGVPSNILTGPSNPFGFGGPGTAPATLTGPSNPFNFNARGTPNLSTAAGSPFSFQGIGTLGAVNPPVGQRRVARPKPRLGGGYGNRR
ncbi:hypothetical protein BCR34DRAFT_657170 [Clohesyomyces aquaticus]|uniref:Uncharacterized protein n=1 Tax=Clohesyomyces aquaticus TaxID=1231657 RepID=A0A1Y2A7B3_9PLEO|nr:hypothetical protein BCR34DRAFT_657170 [Clohesyomyces aquaticus]